MSDKRWRAWIRCTWDVVVNMNRVVVVVVIAVVGGGGGGGSSSGTSSGTISSG